MLFFRKKLIAPVFLIYFLSPVCQASPLPSGCSRYENTPDIFQDCISQSYRRSGVTIVDAASDAHILINNAPENYLILLDGSLGSIDVANLGLKDNQFLSGLRYNGAKPILKRPLNNPMGYVINTSGNHFAIEGLNIRETANPDLVRLFDPGAFFVSDNDFVPLTGYTIAVRVDCGEPSAGTGNNAAVGILKRNDFFLGWIGGDRTTGVSIECLNTRLQIVLSKNDYFMGSAATGIEIHAGGVKIKGDYFAQKPQEDNSSHKDFSVGILFRQDGTSTGLEPTGGSEPDRAFLNTEITCSTFDGGTRKQLIPLSLSHLTASDSPNHNHIRLAFNEFINVPVVLEDQDLGQAVFSDKSVCNVWLNDDSEIDRCAGITTSGFLHFTDNVNCGQAPEGFEPPDCNALESISCEDLGEYGRHSIW